MNITVRKAGDVTILDLIGALKIGGPEVALRESVENLIESGVLALAINLGGVTFLDSSGIGSIVRCHKVMKEKGGMHTFFAPPKMVKQTLKMVSLDKVISIYDNEPAALASL